MRRGHTRRVKRTGALRHCMLVHAHYPIGETRVERQALALIARGHHVDVICLADPDEPRRERVDGVQVYRLPVRRHPGVGLWVQGLEYLAFFALAAFKLSALHLRRRYDVVQVHNLPDALVFAAWLPRLTGARLILDLHDLMPEFYTARRGAAGGRAARLLLWQERWACRFAHHIITVTEVWRETLIGRGAPPEKVSVVMNTADERIFTPAPRPAQTGGRLRLFYHGNLSLRYGLDLVLEALALGRERLAAVEFVIHGWGEARPALERLTRKLGLVEQVRFSEIGLPTAWLPALIETADVCVVPYRNDVFTDAILPTKLMEYAALEMPVIAARTTGMARYFDDSMVEFFEPGDVRGLCAALARLCADPQRRAELGRNIGRFNRQYNWRQQGERYAALVERLAGVEGAPENTTHQNSTHVSL